MWRCWWAGPLNWAAAGCALSAVQGFRARTRYMFQRPFRGKGYIPLSTYLTQFKVGDFVDIKVNGAVHKVRWRRGRALALAAGGLASSEGLLQAGPNVAGARMN